MFDRHRRAVELDHTADRHLAEGRHDVAERLSHQAADIRRGSALLRLRRGAEHLHELGARAQFEFLLELSQACDCTEEAAKMLDDWRAIDPETLRALGGDRFPKVLHVVPK